MDIEKLTSKLSEDCPSGPDLEWEGVAALEELASVTPERQAGNQIIPAEDPDWDAVESESLALAQKTRDLRVAVQLAQASLMTRGWQGLAESIHLVEVLVTEFWADVHPQMESDGEDCTLRLSALGTLSHVGGLLRLVRQTAFVVSRRLGKLTIRDILLARGEIKPREGEAVLDATTVDALLQDADPLQREETYHAIERCRQHAQQIDRALLARNCSRMLEPLVVMLAVAIKVLDPKVSVVEQPDANVGEMAEGNPSSGTVTNAAAVRPGQISTRGDAANALGAVIRFFEETEPGSPVPLLLNRARSLIGVDFNELLRRLAPAGMSEWDVLRGQQDAESGDS